MLVTLWAFPLPRTAGQLWLYLIGVGIKNAAFRGPLLRRIQNFNAAKIGLFLKCQGKKLNFFKYFIWLSQKCCIFAGSKGEKTITIGEDGNALLTAGEKQPLKASASVGD